MSANFTQIIDEIHQQKLQVEARIADTNAKVAKYQTDIQTLEAENAELQAQLEGLVQLENRTNLLKGS